MTTTTTSSTRSFTLAQAVHVEIAASLNAGFYLRFTPGTKKKHLAVLMHKLVCTDGVTNDRLDPHEFAKPGEKAELEALIGHDQFSEVMVAMAAGVNCNTPALDGLE